MRVGWAEEGFMVDLDQSIYEDDEELCPEVDCDEINAELADLKKQLTEAKELLREVTSGRDLLSKEWLQRRNALLKEE